MSGDHLDLDAIEARAKDAGEAIEAGDLLTISRGAARMLAETDVLALVAEVRRLRDRLRLLDPHMPLSQDDVCPHGTTYDLFCGECMSEA